jgi:uncharacterized protein (TIGR02118 family)
MSIKLFAIYQKPADEEAFWKHYNEVHTPLARKVPGMTSFKVNKVVGSPMGEPPCYIIVEMAWADQASFEAAMRSPENAAAAADAGQMAPGLVQLAIATCED